MKETGNGLEGARICEVKGKEFMKEIMYVLGRNRGRFCDVTMRKFIK